jgi:RND family efflux transporter MFP subunit
VQSIEYKDGDSVKKGAKLFVIEPEPYQLKLQQSQAAEESAQATLTKANSDFDRQSDLVKKQISPQTSLEASTATRDASEAAVKQSQVDVKQAQINLGYTTVMAPFDGIVTARQVSIGELVGNTGTPTVLATIVQFDPIYVNFSISETDLQRVRYEIKQRGLTEADLKQIPVEVGLQTETGYPHKGTLDYASPTVNPATGTLAVRGVLPNANRALLPGYFVRVRVPERQQTEVTLVPDVAIGADQAGRYVLVVGSDNVVEQKRVQAGELVGDMRVIDSGVTVDDRVIVSGLLRAVPGLKVDPQDAPASAAAKK